MTITMYSDGGARGNPGPAGIGATLRNEAGILVAEVSEYIGVSTNNQAEYKALIAGLKKAVSLKAQTIHCYLDSELIVKQVRREYKVKNKELAPLFLEVHNLLISFKSYTIEHVLRENNKEADRLANEAMDKAS